MSQGTIAQAALLTVNVVEGIEGAMAQPEHVREGASVKAVFVELWLQNDSASVVGSFNGIVFKNPGGANNPSAADMAALHDWDNKKNILFTSQGLTPQTDSGVFPFCKQWIKIPKGKQRIGLGDKIQIVVRNSNATAIDVAFCGFCVYKDYT